MENQAKNKNIEAMIEALLFSSGEPLEIERIAEKISADSNETEKILRHIEDKWKNDEKRGTMLCFSENACYMIPKPDYYDEIRGLYSSEKKAPLSKAAYEVLAVVAYNQPVTRAQIESIRGVNSDFLINRLEDEGLIFQSGNLDLPGCPAVFECTRKFLISMRMESTDELPPMDMLMYDTVLTLEHEQQETASE